MRVFRNGSEVTFSTNFDDHQWEALSLDSAAMDAQVGMGGITVPGMPGWRSGDRIAIYEDAPSPGSGVTFGGVGVTFGGVDVVFTNSGAWGNYLLGWWYVGDWTVRRNPAAPLELETTYQLMDVNRQLIGRNVVDYTPIAGAGPPPFMDQTGLGEAFLHFAPDLDVDMTWFDSSGTTNLPAQTYTGDGVTDMLASLILGTGWTIYMVPTQTEGTFEYHFHPLTSGPTAGLTIDDTPGAADGITTFAPRNPERSMSATDLVLVMDARNGVGEVIGDLSAGSVHSAGGLKWERVIDYGQDQDALAFYVNSLLSNNGTEKATYSCTIGPLTAAQVVQIPPGSLITTTSTVFGFVTAPERIVRRTLTVSRGETPAPGLWDAHLELALPYREPATALGYGGQHGAAGALRDPYLDADHFEPQAGTSAFTGTIPVGATQPLSFQLVDAKNNPLTIPDVGCTFSLQMWADEAETIVGTGWSISPASDVTDNKGLVSTSITHDATGTSVKVYVVPSL